MFEQTVTNYTPDKAKRLKIIEIATTNSYKDATWAISRLSNARTTWNTSTTKLPEQKICTGVSDTTF